MRTVKVFVCETSGVLVGESEKLRPAVKDSESVLVRVAVTVKVCDGIVVRVWLVDIDAVNVSERMDVNVMLMEVLAAFVRLRLGELVTDDA